MAHRTISFKLYPQFSREEDMIKFLEICGQAGMKKTDIIKLALSRLISDVYDNELPNMGFPPELLETLSESDFEQVEGKEEKQTFDWLSE